jgi:two-component system nitrogen regulation response regulator GlnG
LPIITAFGDLETAVAAVKNGATGYLTKPFHLEEALTTCRSALLNSARRIAPVTSQPMSVAQTTLVGTSPAMQQIFRQIALLADSDLCVLVTGEIGTGKELVSAAIHRHSRRADKPYIAIAPVSLNPELIESELFGHVKGAFTGASDDRAGLFERAEGGTVMLDEIGDLPLGTQVKLLRVLEQGQYTRVGDGTPRTANVRVLAATNTDLYSAIQNGEFREDLFHRLAGVQIPLPPLRQRAEDIQALCLHFLVAMNYPDASAAMDSQLFAELMLRPWHGNIRELKNAVSHAAVVARGRPLSIRDFPDPKPNRESRVSDPLESLHEVIRAWVVCTIGQISESDDTLHARFMAAAEPALLRVVLEHTSGNRAKAAELLGIHRGTLRDRLKTYDL